MRLAVAEFDGTAILVRDAPHDQDTLIVRKGAVVDNEFAAAVNAVFADADKPRIRAVPRLPRNRHAARHINTARQYLATLALSVAGSSVVTSMLTTRRS